MGWGKSEILLKSVTNGHIFLEKCDLCLKMLLKSAISVEGKIYNEKVQLDEGKPTVLAFKKFTKGPQHLIIDNV